MKRTLTLEQKQMQDALTRWPLGRGRVLANGFRQENGLWVDQVPRIMLAKAQPRGVQGWEELLDSIIADGTQISNTTTETIICPDFSIPAFYMQPGRTLRITATGLCSNVVTTPGTLTWRVRWGGVSGTSLAASAALGLDTTARTSYGWFIQMMIVCRTAGATGTFMTAGFLYQNNILSSTAANLQMQAVPQSANAVVTVDTTTAKLLTVSAQFSVATNPTNLTAQTRLIEALN